MHWPKLRGSEWIFVGFFAYVAVASHWFPDRPHLHRQPAYVALAVFAFLSLLGQMDSNVRHPAIGWFRDFLPIALTLIAFREMELFLPSHYDYRLETEWIRWDRRILIAWHLRSAIELLGRLVPLYLEWCYLMVYGLPAYCLAVFYVEHRRERIDRFLIVYLAGTLVAYALFPFFPSQPPRIVFPDIAVPHITTSIRRLNLAVLNAATIHVGVFPSAHVSSAFAAAWGMFLTMPRRKVLGCALVLYAASVSVATVYGRYHYVADVVAGFGVSLVAAVVAFLFNLSRSSTRATADVESSRQTSCSS